MMASSQENTDGNIPSNPYQLKKSYKDALLSDVEDASNKLGVDTFKLIYLINKAEDDADPGQNGYREDDVSIDSDHTPSKTNTSEWYTSRMRFQITLSDTNPETYMDDLVSHVNRILEVIHLNTPGVKLAPWHTTSAKKDELRSNLSDDPMDAIKYLYGFKAGSGKAGPQYFRINLAIPSHLTADDVVKRNKNSIMIPGQQSLMKANSQSINPTTIGWLLRSNPTMVDFLDLEKVLRTLWTVRGGFGLYWAVVRDGTKYDPNTTARALHIETEEEYAPRLISLAEKTYGGRFSNKIEDYPLGTSMMFVRPFNDVPAKACGNVKQFAAYQKTNELMLTSSSWLGEIALDRSISTEKFESFRKWLMSLTSLVEKQKKDGTKYKDKLFTSIHRSTNKQETRFYFYQSNKQEALNVISGLPLMVQVELGLDPGCFFRKADYVGILEGEWNADKREYKNKQEINQAQYLEELDECFLANSAYLPDVVIVDQAAKASLSADMAKAISMANGEDEASVLSQLTDKTLREASARSRQGTTSSSSSVTSVQSGNTSKSKTQAAVRDALKEVSLEHNKAMMEQKQLFQKEIEALRKALEHHTASPQTNVDINADDISIAEDTEIQVEDSSDDEASLKQNSTNSKTPATKSSKPRVVHKRPKRAKYRATRSRGGPSSSTSEMNDE
jgi:hypothetical protein